MHASSTSTSAPASTYDPGALAWCRAARLRAGKVPPYVIAAAMGIEPAEVRRKLAGDEELVELVAFYEEEWRQSLGERMGRVCSLLVGEVMLALETGSALKLGWMVREVRLGHPPAANGNERPAVDSGGPERDGTAMLQFLASLCDLDYEEYCALPGAPYPRREPPLGRKRILYERARAAMRGEAVPAATPEELGAPPPRQPILSPSEEQKPERPVDRVTRAREERQAAIKGLQARIQAVCAKEAPETADELDLAEAVCSLRWPHWPPYEGGLDLELVELALATMRRLDTATLRRLGAKPVIAPDKR